MRKPKNSHQFAALTTAMSTLIIIGIKFLDKDFSANHFISKILVFITGLATVIFASLTLYHSRKERKTRNLT